MYSIRYIVSLVRHGRFGVHCKNVDLSSQRIAPRGWTKEINPLSQTPIYTNSRTGERVRQRLHRAIHALIHVQ